MLSLQAVLRFCLCDPLVSHWITITAQGSLHKCSSLFQAKTHDLVPSPQVYLKNFTGLTRTPIVCICRLFLNSKMCICVGSFSLIYTVYSTDFAIFNSQEISASAVSTRVLQNYFLSLIISLFIPYLIKFHASIPHFICENPVFL